MGFLDNLSDAYDACKQKVSDVVSDISDDVSSAESAAKDDVNSVFGDSSDSDTSADASSSDDNSIFASVKNAVCSAVDNVAFSHAEAAESNGDDGSSQPSEEDQLDKVSSNDLENEYDTYKDGSIESKKAMYSDFVQQGIAVGYWNNTEASIRLGELEDHPEDIDRSLAELKKQVVMRKKDIEAGGDLADYDKYQRQVLSDLDSDAQLAIKNGRMSKEDYEDKLTELYHNRQYADGAQEVGEKVQDIKDAQAEIDKIADDYNEAKTHRGILGTIWDAGKNLFGTSNGSNAVSQDIDAKKAKIAELMDDGYDKNKDEIEQLKNDMKTRSDGYQKSLDEEVDLTADLAAGAAGKVVEVVGGIASVASLGAATPIALAATAATGAAIKSGLKAANAWSAGKAYTTGAYDAATGAASAVILPGTAKVTSLALGKIGLGAAETVVGEAGLKTAAKEATQFVAQNEAMSFADAESKQVAANLTGTKTDAQYHFGEGAIAGAGIGIAGKVLGKTVGRAFEKAGSESANLEKAESSGLLNKAKDAISNVTDKVEDTASSAYHKVTDSKMTKLSNKMDDISEITEDTAANQIKMQGMMRDVETKVDKMKTSGTYKIEDIDNLQQKIDEITPLGNSYLNANSIKASLAEMRAKAEEKANNPGILRKAKDAVGNVTDKVEDTASTAYHKVTDSKMTKLGNKVDGISELTEDTAANQIKMQGVLRDVENKVDKMKTSGTYKIEDIDKLEEKIDALNPLGNSYLNVNNIKDALAEMRAKANTPGLVNRAYGKAKDAVGNVTDKVEDTASTAYHKVTDSKLSKLGNKVDGISELTEDTAANQIKMQGVLRDVENKVDKMKAGGTYKIEDIDKLEEKIDTLNPLGNSYLNVNNIKDSLAEMRAKAEEKANTPGLVNRAYGKAKDTVNKGYDSVLGFNADRINNKIDGKIDDLSDISTRTFTLGAQNKMGEKVSQIEKLVENLKENGKYNPEQVAELEEKINQINVSDIYINSRISRIKDELSKM